MAASSPSEYIEHHLSFFTKSVGDGDFWSVNVDTMVDVADPGRDRAGLPVAGDAQGDVRRARRSTQAFVELCVGFVNDQVKGIYHGESRWVAPIALTVFVWVLLMNAMDFLPVDIMAWFYEHVLHLHKWRHVPTSDINTTFALSLTVFGADDRLRHQVQGPGRMDEGALRRAVRQSSS